MGLSQAMPVALGLCRWVRRAQGTASSVALSSQVTSVEPSSCLSGNLSRRPPQTHQDRVCPALAHARGSARAVALSPGLVLPGPLLGTS